MVYDSNFQIIHLHLNVLQIKLYETKNTPI